MTILAAGLAFMSEPLEGQGRPEFRVDGILSEHPAVHLGAGVLFPLGTYVRSGIVAGAGISDGAASFRADLVNIFQLDPFRESRWAPYGGGGISFRRDNASDRSNAFLLLTLGAEGPLRNGYASAFEIGLGGGVRAGVVMRRSGERTR